MGIFIRTIDCSCSKVFFNKNEVFRKIESNFGLNYCWFCGLGRISKYMNICFF